MAVRASIFGKPPEAAACADGELVRPVDGDGDGDDAAAAAASVMVVIMGGFLPVAAASMVFSSVVRYASLMVQIECALLSDASGAADAAVGW